MRERSLFRTSLVAHFVSLMLLTALVILSFFVSVRRSVDIWNVNRGQRLENLILPILSGVYRQEGYLDPAMIHDKLRHILTANVYAYVFDDDQRPVYIYSLGRRTPLYDQDAVSGEMEKIEGSDRPLAPIVESTDIVGYLTADTVGFTHDAANRRFLMTISGTVITGLIAATIVALGAAWLFSSRMAGQTKNVAVGLRAISEGRRDVSFRPTATRELREISDSAEKLQRQLKYEELLRRKWMEDIAHDLRTPIAAIKSQIEGMAEKYLSVSQNRLHKLYDEVSHIESLVKGLRELSQVESPETDVYFQPVNPCSLVRNVIDGLGLDTDQAFEVECDCRAAVTIKADTHLLRRAVENVVSNAVKNVTTGGSIRMTVRSDDDVCIIDIANSGSVDPAEIPKFFDRLYRGKSADRKSGSGLGLPIAKSIAERHGGRIEMVQREGSTHVLLYLPLLKSPNGYRWRSPSG